MAQRLSERAEGPITVEDVKKCADHRGAGHKVREYLEAGELDGFVRTSCGAAGGRDRVPVFVFHRPAGRRSCTSRCSSGCRRTRRCSVSSGSRAPSRSVPRSTCRSCSRLQGDGPFILAGWSLGGVLAYACAIGLKQLGADVPVRRPDRRGARRRGDPPDQGGDPQALGPLRASSPRRPSTSTIPAIPYEQLEQLDDEGQVQFVLDAVGQSGVQIPAGIIEHQRTSYLDNRAIDTAEIQPYDGHVTLYMADRYHDDAIKFEPRYAVRKPDGGWGEFVSDLEVVPSVASTSRPSTSRYIAKVGEHMSEAINHIESEQEGRQAVTRSRQPVRSAHHRREAGRTPREAGARQGARRREGRRQARQEGHPERPGAHPRAGGPRQLLRDRRAGQDAR